MKHKKYIMRLTPDTGKCVRQISERQPYSSHKKQTNCLINYKHGANRLCGNNNKMTSNWPYLLAARKKFTSLAFQFIAHCRTVRMCVQEHSLNHFNVST